MAPGLLQVLQDGARRILAEVHVRPAQVRERLPDDANCRKLCPDLQG